MGKYRAYAGFSYGGRNIQPQKTSILSTTNGYTFRVRTKSGKWLNSFHIYAKNYTEAKEKAKKFMKEHRKELFLKGK